MAAVNLFQCLLCSETFPAVETLAQHSNHHDIYLKAFRCGFCKSQSFHEMEQLVFHISKVHGELPMIYNCNICKLSFRKTKALEKHAARCQNEMSSCFVPVDRLQIVTKNLLDEENDKYENLNDLLILGKGSIMQDISDCHNDDTSNQDIVNDRSDSHNDDTANQDMYDRSDSHNDDTANQDMYDRSDSHNDDTANQDMYDRSDSHNDDTANQDMYDRSDSHNDDTANQDMYDRSDSHNDDTANQDMDDRSDSHNDDTANQDMYDRSDSHNDDTSNQDMDDRSHSHNDDTANQDMYDRSDSHNDDTSNQDMDDRSHSHNDDTANNDDYSLEENENLHMLRLAEEKVYQNPSSTEHHETLKGSLRPSKTNCQRVTSGRSNQNLINKLRNDNWSCVNSGNVVNNLTYSKGARSHTDKPQGETALVGDSFKPLSKGSTELEQDSCVEQFESCKICSKVLNTGKELEEHLESHTKEECYSVLCVKCNNHFDDVYLLEGHVNEGICPGFNCPQCPKSFGLEFLLIKHIILVHKRNEEKQCSKCSRKFASLTLWARHEARHANSVPFLCKICGSYYKDMENFMRFHLTKSHKIHKSLHSQQKIDGVRYVNSNRPRLNHHFVGQIKRSFERRELRGDIEIINIIKNRSCTDLEMGTHLSGSTVQPKDGTGTKMSSTHTITKEDCYSVLCVKCNRHFEDASLMESHLDVKICPGFKCPKCSKSFGLEFQLIKHNILVHKRNEEKQCSKCGKKCATIRAWARHEAGHAESDPFVCKICGRQFKNLEGLMRYHLPKSHNIQHTLPTSQTICVASENYGSGEEGSSFGDVKGKKSDENKEMKGDKKFHGEEKVEVCVDCDLCGGKVPNQDMLATHRRFHFMDDKYSVKCSGCSDSFNSKTDLIYHVQEKYCSVYNCQECQQFFPTELDYVNHKSQVHATLSECGQYKCPDCQQEFTDHSSYVQHAEDHTTSRPFQCKICDETFVSISTMETHLSLIHTLIKEKEAENIGYTCVRCLTHFRNKDTNMTHSHFHSMKRKIGHGMGDDCDISTVSTPYYCHICHVGFAYLLDLERHKQQHEVSKRPKCSICGKLFLQNSSLQNHVDSHKKSFLCSTCGARFAHKETLEDHVSAAHSVENPLKCHICARIFKRRNSLRSHILKHERPNSSNSYKCKICCKVFPEFNRLECHLLTVHSEEKRFQCNICGARFRHKSGLVAHVKRHNGFRAYKCRYCDRRFFGSHPRNIHEMNHTGEKNFVCSVCGRKFVAKTYLQSHMRIHTKEKPYWCPGCSKRFAMQSNLTGHVRKVHKNDLDILEQLEEQKKLRAKQREADRESGRQYVPLTLAHCTNEINTTPHKLYQ